MTVWRSQIANFSPLGTWGESLPLSDLQPWVCRASSALPLPLAAKSLSLLDFGQGLKWEFQDLLEENGWEVPKRFFSISLLNIVLEPSAGVVPLRASFRHSYLDLCYITP